MSVALIYSLISSSFPLPTYVFGFGKGNRCINFLLVIAPAVSAKKDNSLIYSIAIASVMSALITPTKTQASSFGTDVSYPSVNVLIF